MSNDGDNKDTLKKVLLTNIENSKRTSWYDKFGFDASISNLINVIISFIVVAVIILIAGIIISLVGSTTVWIKFLFIITFAIVIITLIVLCYIFNKTIKTLNKEAIKRNKLYYDQYRYDVNMVSEMEEQERNDNNSINEIKDSINEIKNSINEIKNSTNEKLRK